MSPKPKPSAPVSTPKGASPGGTDLPGSQAGDGTSMKVAAPQGGRVEGEAVDLGLSVEKQADAYLTSVDPRALLEVDGDNGKRFKVRFLAPGDRYGREGCLLWAVPRQGEEPSSGHGEPGVEFYDLTYPTSKFGPLGQFTSRYFLDSIMGHPKGSGLCQDGSIPEWNLPSSAIEAVQKAATTWLQQCEGEWPSVGKAVAREKSLAVGFVRGDYYQEQACRKWLKDCRFSTMQEAWEGCANPSLMTWMLEYRTTIKHNDPRLTLAAIGVAEGLLDLIPDEQQRPLSTVMRSRDLIEAALKAGQGLDENYGVDMRGSRDAIHAMGNHLAEQVPFDEFTHKAVCALGEALNLNRLQHTLRDTTDTVMYLATKRQPFTDRAEMAREAQAIRKAFPTWEGAEIGEIGVPHLFCVSLDWHWAMGRLREVKHCGADPKQVLPDWAISPWLRDEILVLVETERRVTHPLKAYALGLGTDRTRLEYELGGGLTHSQQAFLLARETSDGTDGIAIRKLYLGEVKDVLDRAMTANELYPTFQRRQAKEIVKGLKALVEDKPKLLQSYRNDLLVHDLNWLELNAVPGGEILWLARETGTQIGLPGKEEGGISYFLDERIRQMTSSDMEAWLIKVGSRETPHQFTRLSDQEALALARHGRP